MLKPFRAGAKRLKAANSGHHPRLSKAQAGRALPGVGGRGFRDPRETLRRQQAILTDLFSLQQTLVDLDPQLTQIRPVGQVFAHIKVEGVVDRRLRAQRAILFEVLFHPRMLVREMQVGLDPVLNDPRAKATGGVAIHPSSKDHLHAVGTPQVQVLPNDLLKELTPAQRASENVGATDLHLPDRQPMLVTGGPVLATVSGQGNLARHLSKKACTCSAPNDLAQRLQTRGVRTTQEPIVQSFKGNACLDAIAAWPTRDHSDTP